MAGDCLVFKFPSVMWTGSSTSLVPFYFLSCTTLCTRHILSWTGAFNSLLLACCRTYSSFSRMVYWNRVEYWIKRAHSRLWIRCLGAMWKRCKCQEQLILFSPVIFFRASCHFTQHIEQGSRIWQYFPLISSYKCSANRSWWSVMQSCSTKYKTNCFSILNWKPLQDPRRHICDIIGCCSFGMVFTHITGFVYSQNPWYLYLHQRKRMVI